MEILVSQVVSIPFIATGLVLGKTSFPDFALIKDGVKITPTIPPVFAELGGGIYKVTLSLDTTGRYAMFVEGSIQFGFSVVTKTSLDYLKNLEDEALGSWTWNKSTGLLTLNRQDGTQLATFNVGDTLEAGHRERLA